ncbi:MAG: septum site-determining protein MinC [Comamonadaceae bacterium]|jgi:septum site-determining protein MinC|uniref:septum site-determining protein MinC n=1 Tax=Candidatus Skiveiella danica TaxID=3386177 RepID=UPI0009D0E9B2|nr:septum site-determining protein MinC [Comamonadaceae bacterium]MBK9198715.1 septum site-determining protein MinC [Betaproteobacteria bacterium]OQB98376.1 MAG: Septum site-determining protein MinC [Alphaproteobacteria bacterium ADurb.Bin100]MBK7118070.1 septum site-determining protein MinC [Comamonadaceae bacterium]MBK7509561.1 septum site-determining protein MinC [Comamonadaceae bacterium]
MSVAIAGNAPATFEIKSANLPLVALRLKSTDLDALAAELSRQYGDIPDFFDNDPLVVDLSPLPADAPGPDFVALIALLRFHRLAPLAFKGGTAQQAAAALAAGLVGAPDAATVKTATTAQQAIGQSPPAAPAEPPLAGAQLPALVIDKPLRSGQQVYARGRDLVVMAMVNAGAEVIADGHIHVYAPLRGKAIAGARGNADARIFALSLEPELISIAGIYRTTENALPPEVWGRATQVRLVAGPEGERLVMEPLSS